MDPAVFSDIGVTADVTVITSVVKVDVAAGREILVDLNVTATARLVCSRTLVEFDEPLSGSLTLLAVEEDTESSATESEPAGDQPDTIGIVGGIVDLATPARDLLLLSVPVRPVAPDARNIEIQTSWGSDDDDGTIDPRWAALKDLKS